jgi:hypothetical protein
MLALFVACGGGAASTKPTTPPAQAQAPPELVAIDLFGTRQFTLDELLATHGDELRRFGQASITDDPDYQGGVLAKVEALGDFAYFAPALVGYYEPEGMKYYLTLDFVDRADAARRMPFLPAPTGRYADPDGLLADWEVYEAKVHELMGAQKMRPDRVACPAFHCFGDPTHPEVKQLVDSFAMRVPAHVEALVTILRDDADGRHRAAAAFLLAYSRDGAALVQLMVSACRDEDLIVRNNAMRVMYDVATHHPEIDVPVEPVLVALDYPGTTDRNKAGAVLDALLKRPGAATLRCPIVTRGGATLLGMLRLQQPNNHDFAFSILRAVSGLELGERDYEAWDAWLKTAAGECP